MIQARVGYSQWLLQSMFGSCSCGPLSAVLDWREIAPSLGRRVRPAAKINAGRSGACNNFRCGQQASLGRVPGKFRENGQNADGRGSAIHLRAGSVRLANRRALARRQRSQADAARCRGALRSRRARATARHQAGAVRPRMGWPRGQRRRVDVLHPGVAWRAQG